MPEDNVMDLLDSLDVKQGQKSKPKKSTTKRKDAGKKPKSDDILGFLGELEDAKPEPAARNTPEAANNSDTAKTGSEKPGKSPEQSDIKTEENGSQTSAEPAETDESNTENDESNNGAREPPEIDPVASLTAWWSRNKGGIWSTASRASSSLQGAVSETVKQGLQAEAALREEQPHFSLNSLQSRLTSVLNTIIPPIARHEQVHIHIFHDMVGYPSIDRLLYEVFDYVMDQVEGGGDLNLVVQKGKERHRVGSDHDVNRSLNLVKCSLNDAAKLARANVESIHSENSSKSESPERAPTDPNISISEIYIAIQPVIAPRILTPAVSSPSESESEAVGGQLFFIVYLLDKEHNIEILTPSQGMPEEWADWLDSDNQQFEAAAFDPREWVFGWVEDALNLAFGVTAQKYVTKRMGLEMKST